MDKQEALISGLFREEFSKMVAVITRLFGLQHIEIAEDLVSETFLLATENWAQKGVPVNPAAWLYRVAKQKALHHLRRNKLFSSKIAPEIKAAGEHSTEIAGLDFSTDHIRDSQLRMMFAICNPAIAGESQIGLALRILCGFGIEEIAEAFLSNRETINKRLFRAKEKLRTEHIELEFPPEDRLPGRLASVLRIIYLLFNEGYYSKTGNEILKKDLCLEALRLGLLLTESSRTDTPETNALIALMCFHASRFDARHSGDGFVLYEEQDESLWNRELINQGGHYFKHSMQGNEISSYHLEAGIAFWHCQKADSEEKWENILHYYNLLLEINYSPVVALNRTYALYKARGREAALTEALKLQLTHIHFYFILLGELYSGSDPAKARENYRQALSLARSETEKQGIRKKLEALG